jgi:2-methylcitrate dehydratase PrpD
MNAQGEKNMRSSPPVTDTFAHFIADTDYSTISAKALANGKVHILDTFGAALAAVSAPAASIAVDYCKRIGGKPQASIWGTDLRTSMPLAAFGNGVLAHALDYDDWDAFIHAGHPTSIVAAAALS